jgi:toxin ParE1/3/4
VWSKAALRDLEKLAAYIAEESEQDALLVETRIHESAQLLSLIPACGRPGRAATTRELVVLRTPYILVYRLLPDRVRVLRIFHGARRWPSRFE